ncbi:hypothetical protein [Thalassotalea aquiviva]|uniref:hypothetical protein n=1 Tax=Thalassotalea aquiviva TaxID=3242415 RepID=UPI00352B54F5
MLLALLLTQSILFHDQPDISLNVSQFGQCTNTPVYISLHQDEVDHNRWLKQTLRTRGGVFVELRQSGQRHVYLNVQGQQIAIDPNRIFSVKGRQRSILQLNSSLSYDTPVFAKALDKAALLSQFILKHLNPVNASAIVAMHNNKKGFYNDGQKGLGTVHMSRYQVIANMPKSFVADTYLGDFGLDDLLFITDNHDFKQLQKLGLNLVLQSANVTTLPELDDGSLSVYAQQHNVRYLNIETLSVNESSSLDKTKATNQLAQQRQMVRSVLDYLDSNCAVTNPQSSRQP